MKNPEIRKKQEEWHPCTEKLFHDLFSELLHNHSSIFHDHLSVCLSDCPKFAGAIFHKEKIKDYIYKFKRLESNRKQASKN